VYIRQKMGSRDGQGVETEGSKTVGKLSGGQKRGKGWEEGTKIEMRKEITENLEGGKERKMVAEKLTMQKR